MNPKKEWKHLFVLVGGFILAYHLPVGNSRFEGAVKEAMELLTWYAREHVLLCLVPAFFIAGAIAVFISQNSVMRYLGPRAPKPLAYGVASVSGSILAVCSCTVLPLFTGIYRMGAGLGPAVAFLYSGPAINVMAIIMTARILGLEIGIARGIGAVLFSIIIGLIMHFIYRNEEVNRKPAAEMPLDENARPLWKTTALFAAMTALLIFATWNPGEGTGTWTEIFKMKWLLTSLSAGLLGILMIIWMEIAWWKVLVSASMVAGGYAIVPQNPLVPFSIGIVMMSIITASSPGEPATWFDEAWAFAKQITPLLFGGVLAAGFFLGRPGHEGIIPGEWVNAAVGGNGLGANLLASVVGAFMYFATLTEIPIIQGLMGAGMGKGPALTLLLAGPALSLPNMLVIRSVLGTQKTVAYVLLVIAMATATGYFYGTFF